MKKYISTIPKISPSEATRIGRFIDTQFRGNITPELLLQQARNPSSFLHKYFEWDDSLAAEKYRISQARHIIVSIHVEADDNERSVRQFLKVNIEEKPSYLAADQVKESPDLVEQVIISAKNELIKWKYRYAQYMDYFEFKLISKGESHVIKKDQGRKKDHDSRSESKRGKLMHRRDKSFISKPLLRKSETRNRRQTAW